jgi:phospholipid/cholesterol/gamma-HCH transport system substrate-binding protein
MAKNGQRLPSIEPVETDAIMASIEISAAYAEIITEELAEIMIKINSGAGTLGQLIQDSTVAQNLHQTIINLKKSSKGLDENMEAVKHNFLLKGFFKKKEREAEKLQKEEEEEAEKDQE